MVLLRFGVGEYFSFSFHIRPPLGVRRDEHHTGQTSHDRSTEYQRSAPHSNTQQIGVSGTDTAKKFRASFQIVNCAVRRRFTPSNGQVLRIPLPRPPPFPAQSSRVLTQFGNERRESALSLFNPSQAPSAACQMLAPTHKILQVIDTHGDHPAAIVQSGFSSSPGDDQVEAMDKHVEYVVAEDGNRPKCAFLALPSELRIMIYQLLLKSAGLIGAKTLSRTSAMMKTASQSRTIETAILCTSRSIYQEALQILYGNNIFGFSDLREITAFAYQEMLIDRGSGLETLHCNRLSLLQFVSLKLGAGSFPVLRLPHRPVDRDLLWSRWSRFFQSKSNNTFHSPKFISLQNLRLDFSDWELDDQPESNLNVQRFVPKLLESGGLRRLAIKGVVNRQNLLEFRRLLVKRGGVFLALDSNHQVIMSSSGKEDDLVDAHA